MLHKNSKTKAGSDLQDQVFSATVPEITDLSSWKTCQPMNVSLERPKLMPAYAVCSPSTIYRTWKLMQEMEPLLNLPWEMP